MEGFARVAADLDAEEERIGCQLMMWEAPSGVIEVRDAITQSLLCTITATAEGVLNIAGNAIASFVGYDCGETRSVDLFLHRDMGAPSRMRMLHSVITNAPEDSSIET